MRNAIAPAIVKDARQLAGRVRRVVLGPPLKSTAIARERMRKRDRVRYFSQPA